MRIRLLPQSLFGRLVLVLVAGLGLAQIASLVLHMHERGRVLAEATGMQAAQRIAGIVGVLDPLPPPERAKMAALLSTPLLRITLNGGSVAGVREDAQSRARSAVFAALLRQTVGQDRIVSVVAESFARTRRGPPGMGMGQPESHAMHAQWMSKGAAMQGVAPVGLSFVATVRLRDGSLATFDARPPEESASWPYRLLASLAILFAAVIALSLLAVRWTTRPLKTLADAAEALGLDLDRPPLEERGPVEVQRAARAFNTMQARLAGYVRDRTRVVAAMSHDLKTPITRLRLRAELLDDAALRGRFEQDLGEMESLVTRTLEVLRGLESDEASQPVDVNALVQSLAADARETGGAVDIAGAAHAPYPGKPQALKRCVMNLLDNAIQYGRSAHVVIEDGPDALAVRVLDDGPGIPEAALERVFDPFYRVEGSRNRGTGGTGLGLTIARSIAQTHGGTLVLRNRREGGLEATLTLPRVRP